MSILRLGILGASQTAESIHLPVLHALSTRFSLTILHDASTETLHRCKKRFNILETTTSTSDVLNHPNVDIVLNLLPFEYHEQHTIAALEAGKHVMVEVPLSLSIDGLRRIRAATKKGTANSHFEGGPKVFVGCARRYAPCFTEVFKKELASIHRIYYARCRNIAGPLELPSKPSNGEDIKGKRNNDTLSLSLSLNGTTNGSTNNSLAVPNTIINTTKFHTLLTDIFGNTDDITSDRIAFARFLGTTGSHDLSLVRESFGYPDAVANISITDPFYSAMFHYTNNTGDEHPFTMLYEAGIDSIPRCDSHLTVYGSEKTISLEYDFPCPSAFGEGIMRVTVEEAESSASTPTVSEANGNGFNGTNGANDFCDIAKPRVKKTVHTSTVAEAYERQFQDMYAFFSGNVTAKTDTNDALNDLKLVRMIFEHYDRQCGTIRTPLG